MPSGKRECRPAGQLLQDMPSRDSNNFSTYSAEYSHKRFPRGVVVNVSTASTKVIVNDQTPMLLRYLHKKLDGLNEHPAPTSRVGRKRTHASQSQQSSRAPLARAESSDEDEEPSGRRSTRSRTSERRAGSSGRGSAVRPGGSSAARGQSSSDDDDNDDSGNDAELVAAAALAARHKRQRRMH